jgi:predicted porin
MQFRTIATAAALVGFAATAAAQSSVTVYGKVDLGLRKAVGTDNKELATGSDGRLGFRGTEDLGNGLKAFFNIEHRFFPNTGAIDGSQFWKGVSRVGLSGGWGSIALGRQQIAAFTLVQDQVDPFGADTVAALRDQGVRVGGITKVRIDSSIRYDFSASGLNFAASIAEAESNGGVDRPTSLAVNYNAGPLFLAAGIEDPAGATDRQWNLGAAYNFGVARLSAGVGNGKTNAGVSAKGYLVGVTAPLGAGELKAGYATQKVGGVTTTQKVGIGYHYALSKRTTIYTDVGRDGKAVRQKAGYDLGLKHTF